jgi:hypothetical protein
MKEFLFWLNEFVLQKNGGFGCDKEEVVRFLRNVVAGKGMQISILVLFTYALPAVWLKPNAVYIGSLCDKYMTSG